jgi:5-bromo-4-chloroindolyl phosphate hydrolysis protein
MNTKLTLTIEKEVIETAKKYAKEKGQSLSELVENYFKLISRNVKSGHTKNELSPKVMSLKGVLKVESDFDYKRILEEEIEKKHVR